MAQTFEYPPTLVQPRLLGLERTLAAPTTFRLAHHYFLTRLQLSLKQVYRERPTEYLLHGLYRELVLNCLSSLSFLIYYTVQLSLHTWQL